jgi:creatinine amidohydrolase
MSMASASSAFSVMMIARRLGQMLEAPPVTLEPGSTGPSVQPGREGPLLSAATYTALPFDMGNSLRGMGFNAV